MSIQQLRTEIDQIDAQMIDLFCARMDRAAKIGAYKREKDLEIEDTTREQEVLRHVEQRADARFTEHTKTLYATIFALSRAYQQEDAHA